MITYKFIAGDGTDSFAEFTEIDDETASAVDTFLTEYCEEKEEE